MNQDAQIRVHWEAVAVHWQLTHPDVLWRSHADAINLRLLERWLTDKPVRRLLKTDLFDEAVTRGLYPLLRQHADRVIGIDLSFETARVASSNSAGLEPACANARQLPFGDDTFDVIVSNSSLDHFKTKHELITSLHELHRILRPGGQLLLTLDNLTNPLVALRNALPFSWLNRVGLVPYFVGASFGARRLRQVLEGDGWEIHQMDAIMHCPRVLAVKLADVFHRHGAPETQQRFLKLLMAFEQMARWPTRYLTRYFVAVHAVKKQTPAPITAR